MLAYLPANTLVFGAAPNLSGTIKQLQSLADQQAADSPTFQKWWASTSASGLKEMLNRMQTVLPLLVHLHAKDISIRQAEDEKGKVTGTPVGCACGDGVIDWARIVEILRRANWKGVLSVECGTSAQAADSLSHLQSLVSQGVAA